MLSLLSWYKTRAQFDILGLTFARKNFIYSHFGWYEKVVASTTIWEIIIVNPSEKGCLYLLKAYTLKNYVLLLLV